jgi:hypothetical protein
MTKNEQWQREIQMICGVGYVENQEPDGLKAVPSGDVPATATSSKTPFSISERLAPSPLRQKVLRQLTIVTANNQREVWTTCIECEAGIRLNESCTVICYNCGCDNGDYSP